MRMQLQAQGASVPLERFLVQPHAVHDQLVARHPQRQSLG